MQENKTTTPDAAPLFRLADHPVRVTRRQGAEIISRFFFEISPRSLERWPLPVLRVNGKANIVTEALVTEARKRMAEAAPVMRGGGQ